MQNYKTEQNPGYITPLRNCPRCKGNTLYDRVPRAWWVKTFLFFLPIKRYVCYKCRKKSYIIGSR